MKYDAEDWENYQKGIHYFNRQKYFEAHEAWETIWKIAQDPEDKQFLQGLIQAAAFLLHIQKGEGTGMDLYDSSSEKLKSFRRGYWGIDVALLLGALQEIRGKVGRQEAIENFPTLPFLKKSGLPEGMAQPGEGIKKAEETEGPA